MVDIAEQFSQFRTALVDDKEEAGMMALSKIAEIIVTDFHRIAAATEEQNRLLSIIADKNI